MTDFALLENLNNATGTNNSICYDDMDYCVESTIYRKVLGSIIFVVVWPFIVLDMKWFPLSRSGAALVGATLMVVFVVVPQTQVYIILGEQGNLQTLRLLIGMMLLSYYYDREGMLKFVSRFIFGKNKLFKHVLWRVCVLSAFLSAIITNDATCVVLTPLLLAEHKKQNRSKKEYAPLLLGIATSAHMTFFMTTLPAAVIGIAISVFILYVCYFKTIWQKKAAATEQPNESGEDIPDSEGKDVENMARPESLCALPFAYLEAVTFRACSATMMLAMLPINVKFPATVEIQASSTPVSWLVHVLSPHWNLVHYEDDQRHIA